MQNQEEIKKEKKIFCSWEVFFWEAVLFSLTLGFGIVCAFETKKLLETQKVSVSTISFRQFIFYFVSATLFILIISFLSKRLKKEKKAIFKVLFVFVVGWGGLISLSLWMSYFSALILILILVFGWLRKPTVLSHNLVMVLGIAGIGSTLGLRLDPLVIVAFLVIFSIYDFIAVYITKHMVKMAKEMIGAGTIMGLVLPQEISDFKAELKEVKPGGKFLILGGGDIAFPLLFCASLVPTGFLNSLIVAFFALLGLFFSHWIFVSQKIRKPMPALPPIALFSIIGFLITKLI